MSFLVDTNVLSELRKADANPGVQAWFSKVKSHHLYISVLLVGEVRCGIAKLEKRDPKQANVYSLWLEQLQSNFSDRVLPITLEISNCWGGLLATRPLPVVDGLMAATALMHGLTFVTRNTRDVPATGVLLLNPFDANPKGLQ